MNKKGTAALEAIIASGQVLLLLTVLASLLIIFWHNWQDNTQYSRQRQWAAMAFDYLDRDIGNAQRVVVSSNEINLHIQDDRYNYRVSPEKSFYRNLGTAYYPLAMVDAVDWWWEGDLLWIEIIYPDESYRSCYYIPQEKR